VFKFRWIVYEENSETADYAEKKPKLKSVKSVVKKIED